MAALNDQVVRSIFRRGRLKRLTHLGLSGKGLTGDCLRSLSGTPLRELCLNIPRLNDAQIARVTTLRPLQMLIVFRVCEHELTAASAETWPLWA